METKEYEFVKKSHLKDYTDTEIMDILENNEVISAQELSYINSEAMRRVFKRFVSGGCQVCSSELESCP